MGDREKASLRLQFNPQIRLELHGATITSDAGLLAFRELDDALDLTPIASDYLQESRTGRNIRHHLVPLLRCELVKMSPSRQSVKSWPYSVQVIRCSSQKASAMVFDIPGSFLVSVSGCRCGLGLELGLGLTGCRQSPPGRRARFDREPAACGLLPRVFHALPRIFSFAPWPMFGPGSLHGMPADDRVVAFTGCCGALR